MKVLIIHGPNMNLLGKYSDKKVTLDKLNRSIRRHSKKINLTVKIYQTHDQKKFISLLHSNRNKVDGFIINLGAWHPIAYVFRETLHILNLPYYIVEHLSDHIEDHNALLELSVFDSKYIIKNEDVENAYLDALNKISSK